MKDLFTIEPSEPTNTQSSVPKAPPSVDVETGEKSQEEPEASSENAEVSGAKAGGGKMSQTQLEQVKYILLFNRLFFVVSMNKFVLGLSV